MLLSLHVKNFAIIDEVEIEFKDNLNILTGETGAGKSILIGSINAALGGKVSKEMIRNNAEYALVELLFAIEDSCILERMKEFDIAADGNQVLISRKIMTNGRSISKINGENVTAAVIKEIACLLLDIHGQHEHQSLIYKQKHLEFIDRYAKEDTESLKEAIGKAFSDYSSLKKELEASFMDEEKKNREISFLEYEWNEIEAARLKKGEDIELEAAYKRLSNANQIAEGIAKIYYQTAEGDSSAAELIGRAIRQMSKLTEYDESMNPYLDDLIKTEELLNEFNRRIADYAHDMDDSGEEFAETEKRLDLINHLKSKYGNSIEDILTYLEDAKGRLEKLRDYDIYIENLKKRMEEKEGILAALSEKLSLIRKKKAKNLIKEVKAALIELNFLEVRFDVDFQKLSHFTAAGYDEGEFVISMNPGEALQPLGKVASGGELSRIMLALKSVLAEKDEIETLIFDEIDVGVSGRTAQKVSEKLAFIAKRHQILCITHLPQIAAMADAHFLIEKTSDGKTTKTDIILLNHEDSVHELARILGGVKITESVIKNAGEMKELAEKIKNKF